MEITHQKAAGEVRDVRFGMDQTNCKSKNCVIFGDNKIGTFVLHLMEIFCISVMRVVENVLWMSESTSRTIRALPLLLLAPVLPKFIFREDE